MTTYAQVAARTSTRIPGHLIDQAEIPIVRAGRQGDVYILPTDATPNPAHPVRRLDGQGHNVVRGDADRNSHILSSDSGAVFHEGAVTDPDLDYGLLVVPDSAEAVLTHTGEHDPFAVGPGRYRVFGQFDFSARRRAAD